MEIISFLSTKSKSSGPYSSSNTFRDISTIDLRIFGRVTLVYNEMDKEKYSWM